MLDFLSHGFLGFRADFMSDLLLVALALIVPALGVALWAARAHRPRLHRALMLSVLGVVIGYVVLYETSMMAQGGMSFLRGRIRMAEAPYFTAVAIHVALAIGALVVAVITARRGTRLLRATGDGDAGALRAAHQRIGYVAFSLLAIAVVTGIGIYYLTFVYVSPGAS